MSKTKSDFAVLQMASRKLLSLWMLCTVVFERVIAHVPTPTSSPTANFHAQMIAKSVSRLRGPPALLGSYRRLYIVLHVLQSTLSYLCVPTPCATPPPTHILLHSLFGQRVVLTMSGATSPEDFGEVERSLFKKGLELGLGKALVSSDAANYGMRVAGIK